VKKIVNRLRFDTIMAMSLWPAFWPTLYINVGMMKFVEWATSNETILLFLLFSILLSVRPGPLPAEIGGHFISSVPGAKTLVTPLAKTRLGMRSSVRVSSPDWTTYVACASQLLLDVYIICPLIKLICAIAHCVDSPHSSTAMID